MRFLVIIVAALFHTAAFADPQSTTHSTMAQAAPTPGSTKVHKPPSTHELLKEHAKQVGIQGDIREEVDYPYLNYLNSLKNQKYAPRKTVRILSIDGGGVRGIIPAILVAEIEKQLKIPLTHIIHGFVGTSAGGILALAINFPSPKSAELTDTQPLYNASEVLMLTDEMIQTVFKTKPNVTSLFTSQSLHAAEEIEAFLTQHFADIPLRRSVRPVCVSTFEIITENSLMLCTPMGIHNPANDLLMRTVARATSAAPFYFPVAQVTINNTRLLLTDGGVGANNPVLPGLLEMKKLYGPDKRYHVISLGTGVAKSGFTIENLTKGSGLKMLKPTIVGLFKAQDDITNDYMNELAKSEGFTYTRIQTFLPENADVLDDASPKVMALLKESAQSIIESSQFKKLIADLKKELQEEMQTTAKRPSQG